MKQSKNYKTFFSASISLLLAFMLLAPMGLKLEHGFAFHSKTKECTNNKIHFHSASSHDDLLDYFFQPIVHSLNGSFTINIIVSNQKVEKYYSYLFYSKPHKGIGLRAPPVFMFT